MQRLIVIDSDRAEAANKLMVEEFGPYAANTFSVEMEDETKSKKIVACWNMTDGDFDRLKKKMYRRVACDTYTGKKDKLEKLKINPIKIKKPKDGK